MSESFDFDLLTLGAGSAGVAASRRAAAHGAKVGIVEASRVGGTCVIRGCVPKKLLMYAAQYGDALREAAEYGWDLAGAAPRFEMARWAARKAAEIDRLEGAYRQWLAHAGVTLIEGRAQVVGPHTVQVGPRTLRARRLLIATGATPVRDSIPGIAACPTSDELLDLHELPSDATVIGAGYIALEFASILARLGVRVRLVHRADLPLRGFDQDLRQRVATALDQAGIERLAGQGVKAVHGEPGRWVVELADGRRLAARYVLNATGRRPNTAGLGLETLGIVLRANGAVPVDERLQTPAAEVYAVGDVTDRLNLTPVAIAQGRALADALFGPTHRFPDLSMVATAVFTLPPVGTIGLTEDAMRQRRRPYRVYEADFRPMRHAFFGGAERCYMKLLVDDASDRVMGLHMLGADAPEIVQSLAVALTGGATKAQFDHTVAVHPTVAEEFVLMRDPVRLVRDFS
ncbi:MAG: glutathione-disulfide reductase [Caldimonas manganoxidans]|nr:glutathione-disulfide reductase [Caldimonas manganoxidans]